MKKNIFAILLFLLCATALWAFIYQPLVSRNSALEDELGLLKKEVEGSVSLAEELQNDFQMASVELSAMSNTLFSANDLIKEQQRVNQSLREHIGRLTRAGIELKAEIDVSALANKSLIDREKDALTELNSAKELLNVAQEYNTTVQAENNVLLTAKNKAEEDLKSAELKLASAIQSLSDANAVILQRDAENQSLKKNLTDAVNTNKELEKRLLAALAELDNIKARLNTMSTERKPVE